MYVAILLGLLGLGAFLAARGVQRGRREMAVGGLVLLAGTLVFFAILDFWGEVLWFESLGYSSRLWTEIGARIAASLAGALAGLAGVWILTRSVPGRSALTRLWPLAAGAFAGGAWGAEHWGVILRFLNRVPAGVPDPILGHDVGFFLFTLPFYEAVGNLLVVVAAIAIAAAGAAFFTLPRLGEFRFQVGSDLGVTRFEIRMPPFPARALSFALAGLALALAWGRYLGVYRLFFSQHGAVAGPGWTDVHVRIPATIAVAALLFLLAFVSIAPGPQRLIGRWVGRRIRVWGPPELAGLLGAWGVAFLFWFLSLGLAPALVQWLRVEPNEISFERPYIAHNIEFTRRAFALHDIEEREYEVSEDLTPELASANQHVLSEVRLWDWRALIAVYKQFQEIRLYYEFADVDIDRYRFGNRYRQVMVSARELEPNNLPPQSQTFVNRRFKYTHGYGITMAPVSDFTPDGLPNLLVRDIPPRSAAPEFEVEVPQIYFGELTDSHVFVNTKEEEFDHPSGDENVFVRYSGTGGVPLRGPWRKFLFGWKFDGTRFFLSTYPTAETRVLFHRQVLDRISRVAPFLEFDRDPYIVLVDGKLWWMVDAYTASEYFPYSAPFSSHELIETSEEGRNRALQTSVAPYLHGKNYVRNAVKVVMDAYNGTVDFYVFDPDDPLIQVWQKIYPDLFKPESEMPASLRAHVRYPEDFLLVQGKVFSKYHMTDPAVFYNQEDLWVRATEKYYGHVLPVEPYYVMWEPPGSDHAEFVLILPYTPKNRQVLIGWMAGMCDPPNYGRLLAYKFPKERWVLGPQQVETKIDQDRFLSSQLSLWDQRGSSVIRGNVLAIPIDGALLYVEPIYLRAETAAYPELRLVVAMHGDNLSYGETFEEALAGVFGGVAADELAARREGRELFPGAGVPAPREAVDADAGAAAPAEERLRTASAAFERYLRFHGEGRFEEAGRELQRLKAALEEMAPKDGPPGDEPPGEGDGAEGP